LKKNNRRVKRTRKPYFNWF